MYGEKHKQKKTRPKSTCPICYKLFSDVSEHLKNSKDEQHNIYYKIRKQFTGTRQYRKPNEPKRTYTKKLKNQT